MIVNFMLVAFILLILCCCLERFIVTKELINNTFLLQDSTGALRGIAIIAIAFAHICQVEPALIHLLIGGKYGYTIVFSWGGIGVAIFFLLSGYGCFLSINKTDNEFSWIIKHIVKMLLYFIIAFAFVIFIRIVCLGEAFDIKDCLLNFFTLRLPGTSTWYFKIQILFYILLAISNKLKKNQCYIVSCLVMVYAIVAEICGLSDYWWKTSMCFAIGCCIAKHKELVAMYASKLWVNIVLIIVGTVAFVYTRMDFHYYFIPHLIAYICISVCIVIVWNSFGYKNRIFGALGNASLAMYLIHIGVVDTVYAMSKDLSARTIVFMLVVFVGTIISYYFAEKANKFAMLKLQK